MDHPQRSRYLTHLAMWTLLRIATCVAVATAATVWAASHGATSAVVLIPVAVGVGLLGGGARALVTSRPPRLTTGKLARTARIWKTHQAWRIALHGLRNTHGGDNQDASAEAIPRPLGHRRDGGSPAIAKSCRLTVRHWNSLLGVHRRSPLPQAALQFTQTHPRNAACSARSRSEHDSGQGRHWLRDWAVPRWDTTRHAGVHHP